MTTDVHRQRTTIQTKFIGFYLSSSSLCQIVHDHAFSCLIRVVCLSVALSSASLELGASAPINRVSLMFFDQQLPTLFEFFFVAILLFPFYHSSNSFPRPLVFISITWPMSVVDCHIACVY